MKVGNTTKNIVSNFFNFYSTTLLTHQLDKTRFSKSMMTRSIVTSTTEEWALMSMERFSVKNSRDTLLESLEETTSKVSP